MMTKPPQRAHGTLALTVLFLVACGPPTPSSGGGSSRDTGGAAQPDGGVEQPGEDAGTTGRPDAGAAPCAWPTDNLGVGVGQRVPSELNWQGYGAGDEQERSISIREFFDCDGRQGVHGVLLITSQYGCSRCTSQASGLTQMIESWAQEGLNIKVLTLKIEDSDGSKPASMEGAGHWRDTYGLSNSAVAFDNGYTMIPRTGGGSIRFGTPLNSVIDPRTMEVIDVIQTFDRSYGSLLELARRRAAE